MLIKRKRIKMKKSLMILLAMFLAACSTKHTPVDVDNEVLDIKNQAYNCNSKQAFVANILGHRYISDMGIKCLVGKRTINQAIDLKKVYLHRIDAMPEKIKIVKLRTRNYFIDKNFALAFYVYLKQELEDRGILVVEQASPYVLKVDTKFTNFKADIKNHRFNSKIWLSMDTLYNGRKQDFKITTFQSVDHYYNIYDTPFFSDLLMRQLANKAASIISEKKF